MILPHLYTGGTVTFLHPYTPESWAGERYIEVWGMTEGVAPFSARRAS